MDLIQRGLKKRISKWTNDAYLQLRRHLHRHPTQKSAAFIEESKTEAVVCGHKVCFLTALLCDEGPLGDFHFIIYVGPEEVIAKSATRHGLDSLSTLGTQATMDF